MGWKYSLQSFVWLFPVGRGNAAFVRTGLNQGFIIDMAGGDIIDPAAFIRKQFLPHLDKYRGRGIAQAILSHPHADHISQCGELLKDDLSPALLTCPSDLLSAERIDWSRICNPDWARDLIATYRSLFAEGRRSPPLQTICYESTRTIPNLEYGVYWVRPPVCHQMHPDDDNQYGNATSVVFYLRHGDHSIMVPGDITPDALSWMIVDGEGVEKRFTRLGPGQQADWHERTSNQPSLGQLLREHGLTVLLAPHHGLESCYSDALYNVTRGGKPRLVVVSERRKAHENDGCTDCRYTDGNGGSGLRANVDGQDDVKKCLSTKGGHHILVIFAGNGQPRVYANRDPDVLLAVLNGLGARELQNV